MLMICFLGYGKNGNQKTENTKNKKISENRELKNLRQDLKSFFLFSGITIKFIK